MSVAAMQRFRRYRGVSGLVETTVNRALMTDTVEKGLVIFGEQ
jgi:hypothetical protein